mmetsp:Transcript_10712/g.16168  ORF Transcript_10712/g.16168 Transcript_10712/m.16168 type:complete len:386 (-) Transcript_10712:511-1668(-)
MYLTNISILMMIVQEMKATTKISKKCIEEKVKYQGPPSTIYVHSTRIKQDAEIRFEFRPHSAKPIENDEVLSLVQTSKPLPYGLARHCDWIIGSRMTKPFVAWGNPFISPQTIFVNKYFLEIFVQSTVFKCVETTFVLILGDSDLTMPRQVDQRFSRPWRNTTWSLLLNDTRISHIFVEHLDILSNNIKFSPIPVGFDPSNYIHDPRYFPGGLPHLNLSLAAVRKNITKLPLRALLTARYRGGFGQWQERGSVLKLCREQHSSWCDYSLTGIKPGLPFSSTLKKYPFFLCPHGGGIDPNPNLFTAIFNGVIPIVRHLDDFPAASVLYAHWPIVFVHSWNDITPARLAEWRSRLAPAFESENLRKIALYRLSTRFWWHKITTSLLS